MNETAEKIVYIATHAGEDPERASMPFVMASAAMAMDIQATIALQGNGVYLAQKGYVDNVLAGGGFPHIKELINMFLELDGKLKVCVPCIKARNIKESDLIEGAETTAAAALTEEILAANKCLVY